MGINEINRAVEYAWNSIGEDYFQKLLDQMPARCQAVINAQGRITKY
jgi:hypothetical protein